MTIRAKAMGLMVIGYSAAQGKSGETCFSSTGSWAQASTQLAQAQLRRLDLKSGGNQPGLWRLNAIDRHDHYRPPTFPLSSSQASRPRVELRVTRELFPVLLDVLVRKGHGLGRRQIEEVFGLACGGLVEINVGLPVRHIVAHNGNPLAPKLHFKLNRECNHPPPPPFMVVTLPRALSQSMNVLRDRHAHSTLALMAKIRGSDNERVAS